ncbi:MAG TPA: D-aminoacylase, partial [Allosphingosinicella sp.]
MKSSRVRRLLLAALPLAAFAAAAPAPAKPRVAKPPAYDLVIRGGTIYDGSGGAPYKGDVGVKGDRIAYVGTHLRGRGAQEIDAKGLAVSPGFINMLSWAAEPLIADGRAQSDIRQGVTLEVFGEGWSMGPWNAATVAEVQAEQTGVRYPVTFNSLGGYFDFIEKRGTSVNVASFVGASSVRVYALGRNDVDPTAEQLGQMRGLVREAMNQGAMGVGSSLIYIPAAYAETDELVALSTEAARCGGMYISHIRNEGAGLLRAIDELIDISRRSGARAEVYHLKAAGR